MTSIDKKAVIKLHELKPRENIGRDTITRFDAQFRGAAFKCFGILEGKTIDRVYCDYHEDFVVRMIVDGNPIYHFYQVKTKKKNNYLWNSSDLFNIGKTLKNPDKLDPSKLASSYIGKLLVNTIKFKDSCGSVVFFTNINLDNEMTAIEGAIKSGQFSNGNRCLSILTKNFEKALVDKNETINDSVITTCLQKLRLESDVKYLHPNYDESDFEALARSEIYKYSEIDLEFIQCKDLVDTLLRLVHKKSSKLILEGMTESEIDDTTGIGLHDLLEILSISKSAYAKLISGGDSHAIKNVSLLQRKLNDDGCTSERIIEFVCDQKVRWDEWDRNYRHNLSEMTYQFLREKINNILTKWQKGRISFQDLEKHILILNDETKKSEIANNLTNELLLGAIFAEFVRSEAR